MSRSIKALSVFTIAAAIALMSQPAFADTTKHKLDPGDMALLFSLSSLFNSAPTDFDNIGIGGRYVAAPRLTIRAGLGLNQNTSEQDVGNATVKNESTSFALEGGVEYLLFQTGPAGMYVGGILQYANRSTNPDSDQAPEETDTTITVAGIAGVNYFLLDELSLGAEYRLGWSQVSQEDKVGGETSTDTNTTIGTGSVGFILSFWFH